MKYKVINLLNGTVTIVVSNSLLGAIKKGQNYFTEPNRTTVPVPVLN